MPRHASVPASCAASAAALTVCAHMSSAFITASHCDVAVVPVAASAASLPAALPAPLLTYAA